MYQEQEVLNPYNMFDYAKQKKQKKQKKKQKKKKKKIKKVAKSTHHLGESLRARLSLDKKSTDEAWYFTLYTIVVLVLIYQSH